jgi:hypothetical protein
VAQRTPPVGIKKDKIQRDLILELYILPLATSNLFSLLQVLDTLTM